MEEREKGGGAERERQTCVVVGTVGRGDGGSSWLPTLAAAAAAAKAAAAAAGGSSGITTVARDAASRLCYRFHTLPLTINFQLKSP